MKNKSLLVILVLVAIIIVFAIATQRSLVGLSEEVDAAWGDIEVQYQRRADLIPNLVETVKAQAIKEQEIFTEIAEARSKLAGGGSIEERINANEQMTSVLGRLLMITENYPQLKQDKAFQDLRVELEGTENRIAVARKFYNDHVKVYNKKVKIFPTNLVANAMGYEAYPYIKAAEGAENAPKVDFNTNQQ